MRFHLVSLPHTNTTEDFPSCAFTHKVVGFAKMMTGLGHEVFLYAGEANTAPCTAHFACIDEAGRVAACDGKHYTQACFDPKSKSWTIFNANAVRHIAKHIQPKDFICVIGGWGHKVIADAFPNHMTVEFGIGYGGTFAKYRVWESYAWMHMCYGAASQGNPNTVDGIWFDAVIPGYFDVAQFPFGPREEREDYFLYVGRLIDRKGWKIAEEVCKYLGKRLIIAGEGDTPIYGEHVGTIGPASRGDWMSRAQALIMPTVYIEPFGNVAVEAMLCGTPVISTDWGAMTETVAQGVTGFRCRSFQDFVEASYNVKHLSPDIIRNYAQARYSLQAIGSKYERYFERLLTLWTDGWYYLPPTQKQREAA